MGAAQLSVRGARQLPLAALVVLAVAVGCATAWREPDAQQAPVPAAPAQNPAAHAEAYQPSKSDYAKEEANYNKPSHTPSYSSYDDDSEEGDEGFAQFLVPPTACPSWATCPLPGEVPVQPSYPSDGNCAPGFGFVKAKKHSYEDGSYDSYSEPRGTCFPCKSGFYSPGGQAICRPCGAGEGWFTPFGSSCLADCMCAPGYGGMSCTQCPAGTWSAGGTFGNTRPPCTPCPVYSAGSPAGAANETQCGAITCPANYYQNEKSLERCDGDCPACVACPPQATSIAGSTSFNACRCPANTYLDLSGEAPQCTQCPPLANSAAGSTSINACACRAGYYLDLSSGPPVCQACPVGTPGSAAAGAVTLQSCLRCVTGYLDAEDGVCKQCPAGSNITATATYPTSIDDCSLCEPGFGIPIARESESCCQRCAPCPPGTFSAGGEQATCAPCPPQYTSAPGSVEIGNCYCTEPGYCVQAGRCLKAPSGFFSVYNPNTGNNDCAQCTSDDGEILAAYTTFEGGASSRDQCACAVGYGWDPAFGGVGACVACIYPRFQGYLAPNVGNVPLGAALPVTSATPENPRPVCVACTSTLGIQVGNPNKVCLTTAGQSPGAYCGVTNSPVVCRDP